MSIATIEYTERKNLKDLPFGQVMFFTCCIVAFMFQFRDSTTGILRFYLQKFHLSFVWFIPDILCVVALLYFIRVALIANRSIFGWVLLINAIAAFAIGAAVMSFSMFAAVSAIKLFLPLFCGFAFAGRSMTEKPWMRWTIFIIMAITIIGVIANTFTEFPWVGAELENFGYTRIAARLWWAQDSIRYGGFAGDSTSAAYLSFFPYIIIHKYMNKYVRVALWLPIGYVLWYANSKTAIITAVIFVLYYMITYFVPKESRLEFTRSIAKLSFFLVPIPFLLILVFSGIKLGNLHPLLFSMEDRINNTWVTPLAYFADNFPIGFFSGCGLGCFVYPMNYTDMAYLAVPVDNFYLSSYVMLGLPFIFTIIGMFVSTYKTKDETKLILVFLTNIYSVTVHCYGPSAVGVIVAYAFSDMFLSGRRSWHRKRSADSAPTEILPEHSRQALM